VWWDEAQQKWTGEDTPDFIVGRPPSYRPPEGAQGTATISGIDPFVMQKDGKAWLYAPNGIADGPLPSHYEPQEAPVKNGLYGQQCNPARMEWIRPDNPYHRPYDDPEFPFVVTTYRVTEHHTAGGMSRWLPWLSELQPELFCEVSPELASRRKLKNGGWATLRTARGEIEARVLVTRRMRPLKTNGHVVHQIGVPYHWAGSGLVTGDCLNELIGFVADPNVAIQESKVFTCDILEGRRSRKRRVVTSGPLAAPVPKAIAQERDLPAAQPRPEGSHESKTTETKEGNQ
jgi:formate dehydrogenase major subunit